MAMEEVLDGVRRIIHKWVNTTTRITSDITAGDTTISVQNTARFNVGDPVMIKNDSIYETGLYVESIDADQPGLSITLTTPVLNNWSASDNVVLIKTIYEQFVQGIYIGDPDVIPKYPAITVNGVSRASEWMTLESTKERFEIEVGVYVLASTQEKGYRFLMNITDEIQKGLKRNIMPLVNEYDIISLAADVGCGDKDIRLNNRTAVEHYHRIIIEDEYASQENWIDWIYPPAEDPLEQSVRLHEASVFAFDKDDTSVIVPKRFIYNSWPATIQYGTIHKGELLKAAKISWFAEEEEMQWWRRTELKLR
jgi:hypothetical protein